MKQILNNKYYIIFVYSILPILIFRIIPILLLIIGYIYITSDVWLCDDGNSSSFRVNGWGGELDGRPINNNNVQGYDYQNNNAQYYSKHNNVNYEPYRPWYSQETSQGIRYEMDANGNNYHPYGPNSYNIDPFNRESESTLLGSIEPSRSELENNGYYVRGAYDNCYVVNPGKPSSIKRSLWNWVKNDLNETRKKVEARRIKVHYQNEVSISGRDVRAARYVARTEAYEKAAVGYTKTRKVKAWG